MGGKAELEPDRCCRAFISPHEVRDEMQFGEAVLEPGVKAAGQGAVRRKIGSHSRVPIRAQRLLADHALVVKCASRVDNGAPSLNAQIDAIGYSRS